MALHCVQGVELNEADLTVEGLLVTLLLLLWHGVAWDGLAAEAEACGQTQALHLSQSLAVHSIAVNFTSIFNLKQYLNQKQI